MKYCEHVFLDKLSPDKMKTTSEIADEVGCKYLAAYEWLVNLYNNGEITRSKIGGSFVWGKKNEGVKK